MVCRWLPTGWAPKCHHLDGWKALNNWKIRWQQSRSGGVWHHPDQALLWSCFYFTQPIIAWCWGHAGRRYAATRGWRIDLLRELQNQKGPLRSMFMDDLQRGVIKFSHWESRFWWGLNGQSHGKAIYKMVGCPLPGLTTAYSDPVFGDLPITFALSHVVPAWAWRLKSS